jgi:hypothetical protein
MKNHFYFLLSSMVLLAGCRKDKESQPSLDGSFVAGPVISATDIVLYTSTGRVDNQAVVDKFLARRKNMATYFSRVDTPLPTGYSLTLAFRGNNRVTLLSKGPTSTDSVVTEITAQSPQRLVLAEMDSISILRNPPQNRAEQLSELIPSERPTQRCWNVAVSVGTYTQACRMRFTRVITRHDGKLFLPQLSWVVQAAGTAGSYVWAYSGVQNTFNAGVVNQLLPGDTLVVQAREIPFSKK